MFQFWQSDIIFFYCDFNSFFWLLISNSFHRFIGKLDFFFCVQVFWMSFSFLFWILTILQIIFLPCQLCTFSFHKYIALEGACKEEEEERTYTFLFVSCGLPVCFPVTMTIILVEILHPSNSSWIQFVVFPTSSQPFMMPAPVGWSPFSKGILVPKDHSSKFRDASSSWTALFPQGPEFQVCRIFPPIFWVLIIPVPSLDSSGPRLVAFSCSCYYLPDPSPSLYLFCYQVNNRVNNYLY